MVHRLVVCALSAAAVALAGCGAHQPRAAGVKSVKHAQVTKPAPTYRAGQYCVAAKRQQYRKFGFRCASSHLRQG